MARHVLITGGSQGTGKATALKFARAGWNVTIAARKRDRLQAVAQAIEATGQKALAVPTDIGIEAQVNALVEQSIETFGKIDALINNAGICLTGPAIHTHTEDWQRLLDTNLWGCIYTIQNVLPTMIERGEGSIINVGSIGGKMPLPGMTAYCASKYALTGLTESLRLELASTGVHLGIVHPGVIDSDFMERAAFRGATNAEAESQRQQMQQALQSGIASQPEEIAKAVWKAVEKKQAEVVVGPAAIATELNRLFPQLTQWALSKGLS